MATAIAEDACLYTKRHNPRMIAIRPIAPLPGAPKALLRPVVGRACRHPRNTQTLLTGPVEVKVKCTHFPVRIGRYPVVKCVLLKGASPTEGSLPGGSNKLDGVQFPVANLMAQ